MRSTRMSGIAAVAAAGILLAGCGDDGTTGGSEGGGDKDITWWVMKGTNANAKTFYDDVKAAYKKKTGGTLTVSEVEWADAHDRLVRAFAGGDGPDVSEIGTTWTPEFAAAGGLTDLTDKINKSKLGDDLLPALKDSATHENKQYGVGWYAGTRGIVYRKDVFAKHKITAPKNWAELQQAVKTLKAKEPKMLPMPIAGASSYAAAPFIWGAGGGFAEESGGAWKGTLDSPKSQEGLKFYTELATKHGSSSTGASTWKETQLLDSFAQGKAAMVIQGNWTPKTALEQNPSLKGKIGAMPVPGKDSGMAPTFLGGSNLAVLKTSKKPDAAWQLVQLLTTGELAKKWASQTGYFPSTKSGMKPFVNSKDPLVSPFAKAMMEAGKNVPNAPAWGKVESDKTITKMLQSTLTGTPVDKATGTASKEITTTLNAK
ncbi:sugar ABC transporter substrate-binding protein [Demetria terragena]|uniref:sugar ABC transporter substrate-binding protein n=1 Tax=Demetria terragena TaxID=63959 RepID=UPI0003A20809|nr:sugar ABC transporter substrate-binding protein [Demetria terragena]